MINFGFFDSVSGDRRYSADDFSGYIGNLISDGVIANPSTALQVQASAGMTVKVKPGWAYVQSHYIHNDADLYLTLDAADLALYRADRIVLRLDRVNRRIDIAVKTGTVSENQNVVPALQRDENIWELSLAWIHITPGMETVEQHHIHDEREQTDVCGLVTGLIDQIDTTNLFAQYDAAFNKWFSSIQYKIENNWVLVERVTQAYYDALAASNELDSHTLYLIDESIVYFPDMDEDGGITAADAAIVQEAAAKIGTGQASGLTPVQEVLADADRDGTVTAADAALVLDFVSSVGATGRYDNDLNGWKQFLSDEGII